MPQYRLKANVPDFEVVDGPCAGRKYRAGETYSEIPPQEKDKFEVVREPRAEKAAPAAPAVKEEPEAPAPAQKAEGGKK